MRKSKKHIFKLNCKQCNKLFFVFITNEKYKKGDHKLHCSKKCSHKRVFTEEIKLKISNSVKSSNLFKINNTKKVLKHHIIKICPICNTKFDTVLSSKIKTCRNEKCTKIYRKTILKKACKNNGGYRESAGYKNHQWYISPIAGKVFLDSLWELEYAKYLDRLNILWSRNTKRFPYIDEHGKNRYWIPDFYLHDSNLYVEIKGYQKPSDEYKWKFFPHKLKILKENDLKELKLLLK